MENFQMLPCHWTLGLLCRTTFMTRLLLHFNFLFLLLLFLFFYVMICNCLTMSYLISNIFASSLFYFFVLVMCFTLLLLWFLTMYFRMTKTCFSGSYPVQYTSSWSSSENEVGNFAKAPCCDQERWPCFYLFQGFFHNQVGGDTHLFIYWYIQPWAVCLSYIKLG